ncbi:hypothetical protein NM208_g2762 [Fusarium decemcellulare]|uniref:Uncharacterized protein n=1 Tax=Fusarium decemcellulare TaxID=57161 RepID=A0ACC1SRL2_9HYPO|nr:hypothetical protein NM208_g2762 [Fusarium decemcellulare]
MSDPLSVAGTAVGIASLGIQVCQGLVSYLQSLEGRNQEIREGLREIQTLVSMFYSLNDILPKIDEKHPGTIALRRCLEDSEKKLLELQEFLIKIRGPQNASTSTIGKMDDARRALIYPFREGKLNSLRQSLRELLDNLNLAIELTLLDSGVAVRDTVNTLEASMQDLGALSKVQCGELQGFKVLMRQNSDQLQSLDRNVTSTLTNMEQRLSQTQLHMQDLSEDIRKLILVSSDTHSGGYKYRHFGEEFAELAGKMDVQSTSVSRTKMKIAPYQGKNMHRLRQLNRSTTLGGDVFGPSPRLPGCNCELEYRPSAFSFAFWHIKFEYEHHSFGNHLRGCKYYGIDSQTQRTIKAQVPTKLAWLSSRFSLACIDYSLGTSSPGISVRYKNLVPQSSSPVVRELEELSNLILWSKSDNEIILAIESAERAILSLYRDGKASPTDRDEDGLSHATLACVKILSRGFSTLDYDLILTRSLKLIDMLVQTGGVDDEEISTFTLLNPIEAFCELGQANWALTASPRSMSYVAQTFRLNWNEILSISINLLDDALLRYLTESYLVHAILMRSMDELEECISYNSLAPLEVPFRLTTLHLCIPWPSGLRRLLATKARELIDEAPSGGVLPSPIDTAIEFDCVESADILMEAGCKLDFEGEAYVSLQEASRACFDIIAFRLAQRRRELLRFAQQKLGILPHLSPSDHVPDDRAAHLCKALDEAGIAIPAALRVPKWYTTIYHDHGTVSYHFPILFKHGFLRHRLHNNIGLSPIMCRRFFWLKEPHESWNRQQRRAATEWIQKEGFFDQTPIDPHNLGLNIHATGWHYVAAISTYAQCNREQFGFDALWDAIIHLSQVRVKDNCVCWCNAGVKGCSPLKSFLKAYSQKKRAWKPFRHDFFHHSLKDEGVGTPRLSELVVQLVRFLTFEALEMTHTCCYLTELSREKFPDPPPFSEPVALILSYDAEKARRIRSDEREQDNARLLEDLMQDFIQEMEALDPSPRAFEIFIWGYWRRRISALYTVDRVVVDEMRQSAGSVKTHVLPERLQSFLDDKFELVEEQGQEWPEASDCETAQGDEMISVEEIVVISFPNLDDFIDALDNDTWPAAYDDDKPIPKIEGSDTQETSQPSQTSLEAEASQSKQSPQVNSGASNSTTFSDDSSLSDSLSNHPSSTQSHGAQWIGSRAEIRHLYITQTSIETGNPVYSTDVPIAAKLESNQCKQDDNKAFAILHYHGASLQTTSIKIQSPELKRCLAEVLSGYPRVDTAAPTVEFAPPFTPFLHRWERFLQAEAVTENERSKEHLRILQKALEIELEDPFQTLQEIRQTGYVTFPSVPVALVPGEILLTFKDGMMSAGILQDAYIEKTYQGEYVCRVKVHVLDWNGSGFGYREQQWDLESFEGFRKVTDLPVFPLRAHPDRERIKKRLIERGRSFEDLCSRRGVSNYNGLVIDDSGWEPKTIFLSERIIVDAKAFYRFQHLSVPNVKKLDGGREEQQTNSSGAIDDGLTKNQQTATLTEDQCLLAVPKVRGFALKAKQWYEFAVNDITLVVWNEQLLGNLVIQEQEKRLLLALVSHTVKQKDEGFDDFVEGKGKGLILLLAGPGMAEELKRPLYRVSAGDLGLSANKVECYLKRAFDLCSHFNAVLLIDEADVFLEKRSSDNLAQNELVSIFLTTLEYYQGVLILTTNRTEEIDSAFESRIDIILTYDNLSQDSRRQVWSNFLGRLPSESVNISDTDLDHLSKWKVNGRQIKSAIKTARIMANSEGAPLGVRHLEVVLEIRKRGSKVLGTDEVQ